jgi:peroxiredoxin Q/BCP
MPLPIGSKAPDFSLPSTAGRLFSLHEHMLHKPCILYFYPKDFTPGCTAEACDFRDHFNYFKDLQIEVLGISQDSVETHLRFKEAYSLPFELLSDTEAKIAGMYKAKIPLLGVTARVTYLLDTQHTIKAAFSDLLGARKHLLTMIEAVKKDSGFTTYPQEN